MVDVRPSGMGLIGSCDLLSKMSITITIHMGLVILEQGTIHGAEALGTRTVTFEHTEELHGQCSMDKLFTSKALGIERW